MFRSPDDDITLDQKGAFNDLKNLAKHDAVKLKNNVVFGFLELDTYKTKRFKPLSCK